MVVAVWRLNFKSEYFLVIPNNLFQIKSKITVASLRSAAGHFTLIALILGILANETKIHE